MGHDNDRIRRSVSRNCYRDIMYDPPIEIPGSSEACEADDIEMGAADCAYKAGLCFGEWEAFLTPDEVDRLILLGAPGIGTWGHEPHSLERAKSSR